MADSRWWKDFDAVLAAAVPAGSRILDVGCGDGGLVDRLAELGFDVFGVDPAAPSHQRLVPVRVEDAQLLGEFDAVAAVMALHHADLDAVVRALANLLRPRGSVFIYEFSWDAYDGRAAAWLAKHDLSPADNSVAGWRREHSELHTTATIKTPTAGSGEGYPHFHPHTGCRKPNLAHPGLDGQRLHVWAVSAGRRLFLGARLRVYDQGADLRVLIDGMGLQHRTALVRGLVAWKASSYWRKGRKQVADHQSAGELRPRRFGSCR